MNALQQLNTDDLNLNALTYREREEFEKLLEEYVDDETHLTIDLPPFEDFCQKYLGKYFTQPMPTFRKDTIQFLNDHSEQHGKKFVAVEPRSHGKSTTYVVGYSIYQLCYGLRNFIVYFGPTKEEAKGFMNNIRMEFENNELLLQDFPFMKKETSIESGQNTKWTDSNLYFATGQRISCKGWHNAVRGMNHYGKRPDFILMDDVENEKTVSTPYVRERFMQYYTNAVANLAGHEGCDTFIVGTLLHPEAFLARAVAEDSEEQFSGFRKSFHKAVIDWNSGEVLWPEAWPLERLLEQQKEIGEAAFAQEFQGVPARLHQQLFSEEKIKTFKRNSERGLRERAGWLRFLYVDPSMGKQNGDFSSLCVAYLNPKNERYIIDWITKRYTPDELCAMIAHLHDIHNFNSIGFEVNATQGLFINLFKQIYKEKHIDINKLFVPINHSLPKKNRIDALEPSINGGRILFNPKWREMNLYALGLRQLFNYDGRSVGDHDDGPDALAGVNELINLKRGVRKKGKWTNAS